MKFMSKNYNFRKLVLNHCTLAGFPDFSDEIGDSINECDILVFLKMHNSMNSIF